ncbi:MAG: ribosome-associated translation inhibitor RaiA [Saprospiraceae bacterium]|nr:MAG: ribosomal subunit interface protein [Bacteroidetes bacterium OLB9]MCO6464752.1 ribosome-associated translation inhibitor RaiA [Saprospiraceae bacterium]MCZ2339968.1 ribosome-associated translation inhibitor RaiA [Chitinophagales bacterium]
MKITIQDVRFTADQKLKDYISDKLQKLDKFHSKIIETAVYLKLENAGQIKDKVVEMKLNVPGSTLMASSTDKTFEAAFDDGLESMKRQLKKINDKAQVAAR